MDIKHIIKKRLQDYYKKKIIFNVRNKGQSFDFKGIKKTALLFFIRSKTDLDLVRGAVKTARKFNEKSYPVIFSDVNYNVDIITDRDFFIFNADDFNYKWKPKSNLSKWLEGNNFDLLINFCFDGRPETTNLYTLLRSKFRIANQNPNSFQYNDLTINIKEKQVDFNSFYNLAIDNLRMLNIRRN